MLTAILGLALHADESSFGNSGSELESAYADLVSADHWRKAKAAAERLGSFGDAALPAILRGTQHEASMVREYCYELLRSRFPKHPNSVAANIRGLRDKEPMISYPCAFHLGNVAEAREALAACVADGARDGKTRYAAAKSLAELGDEKVMTMLYSGLGSDDHYTRYLSNIGVKALCGKNLVDFGYEGPWEGSFVSGPAVYRVQGQPIDKAKKRLGRWQAIVRFSEWMEKAKPDLFKELDDLP